MKKEIKLADAVNRWGEGKDTLLLIPSNDSEGNLYFVPGSFMKHMEKLGSSLFLIDDEESGSVDDNIELTKKNIEQINENIKPDKKKKDKNISSKEKKSNKIDIGKMVALYNAGWTVPNIAGEMRMGRATVYKYLKLVREGKLSPEGMYNEPDE